MTKDEFERLGHRTRMVLRVAARHYGDYGAIEALTGSSRRSVQSMMYGLRQRFGMSDAELLEGRAVLRRSEGCFPKRCWRTASGWVTAFKNSVL